MSVGYMSENLKHRCAADVFMSKKRFRRRFYEFFMSRIPWKCHFRDLTPLCDGFMSKQITHKKHRLKFMSRIRDRKHQPTHKKGCGRIPPELYSSTAMCNFTGVTLWVTTRTCDRFMSTLWVSRIRSVCFISMRRRGWIFLSLWVMRVNFMSNFPAAYLHSR